MIVSKMEELKLTGTPEQIRNGLEKVSSSFHGPLVEAIPFNPRIHFTTSQSSPPLPKTGPLVGSQPCEKRKRRVRFNSTIRNRRVQHLKEIPKSEVLATWIQPEEYLEIRKRCIATVQLMTSGQLEGMNFSTEQLEQFGHCLRGLEGKTKAGAMVRRGHKFDSIAAVMEEQMMQWDEDVEDEEAIMEVYTVFSIPCSEHAHQLGLSDHQAANEYLQAPLTISSPASSSQTSCSSNSASTQHLNTLQQQNEEQQQQQQQKQQPRIRVPQSGLVDKLREMLLMRLNRAALLKDIEHNFYEEASIERRRKCDEAQVTSNERHEKFRALAVSLRDYFDRIPSARSFGMKPQNESNDEGGNQHDDDDGSESSCNSSVETFETQLHDIFHTRKRRQALLDSIEESYSLGLRPLSSSNRNDRGRVTSTNAETSNEVSMISKALGSKLSDIFSFRKRQAAVLNELGSSIHRYQ